MSFRLYNTLTRNKDEFVPITEGHVGMYVCGPTVYGPPHIGHARSYVVFDLLHRFLKYKGCAVKYVQNITDVGHLVGDKDSGDDKIQKQALIEKVDPMAIAYKYECMYFDCMDKLNVLRPTISCRATGYIMDIIEMVSGLIEKGVAYVTDEGNVYYDVRKFPNYGKLSGRTLDDTVSGERIEIADDKKNPEDFALWKKAEKEHIMKWNSPWSIGYPGWHIECSVMSKKYLGNTFDIHGGGMDNVFPHHECEIAQSEVANGCKFVNYFIHNNLITVDGQKMGKSLGNVTNLEDLFKKYDSALIRLYIVKNHYRSVLDFSEGQFEETQKIYDKFVNLIKITNPFRFEQSENVIYEDINRIKEHFIEAMDDDLNTAVAVADLLELCKEANKTDDKNKLIHIRKVFDELAENVLGLKISVKEDNVEADNIKKMSDAIVEIRNNFKANKQYEYSDLIRNALKEHGVSMIDTKDGVKVDFE